MILVDVNLLLYAINSDAPQHQQARQWWEQVLSGTETVGLPWVVALAFIRISTHPKIFSQALSVEAALFYLNEWLEQPVLRLVTPGKAHWSILRNLLQQTGTAGNLTTDAHIAALALEQGYSVFSADNDFKRYPGLKHVNPLIFCLP
ncbi:MAG: type II toxin-antitoxin system VapC family toxin [Pseudomonadota bacterium]|nr:type II toxin-antitoxin system VapC family toxin [Pseudomonadota bacterium]